MDEQEHKGSVGFSKVVLKGSHHLPSNYIGGLLGNPDVHCGSFLFSQVFDSTSSVEAQIRFRPLLGLSYFCYFFRHAEGQKLTEFVSDQLVQSLGSLGQVAHFLSVTIGFPGKAQDSAVRRSPGSVAGPCGLHKMPKVDPSHLL